MWWVNLATKMSGLRPLTTISTPPNPSQKNKIHSPVDQMSQTAANFTKTNKTPNNEYTAQIIKPQ